MRLELAFNFDKQEFRGKAIHKLTPFKPVSKLEFDAAEMKIERVWLPAENGAVERELKHESAGGKLNITLDREYAPGDVLQVAIAYFVSRPRHGAHFVEPGEREPGNLRMVWTQSEPEYARFWFPCLDTPADRLTSETLVTVPKDLVVLSNGALQGKQPRDDGTVTWHWVQAKSHVPYLMSVVAGDFETLEQEWSGIPVQSYVPRGRLPDAARSFEKTPAMLKFFSEKIGYRYPWPKYAQICVDEYHWGGMEHTSATTLNLSTLHDERAHLDVSSINLVAHELAHQWWGDLLTCKDWGELWLNESFATYFANLWIEHDEGADEAAWERRGEANSYLDEDNRYRRSIVNYRYDTPEVMFDRHSYPKGGRVLHMLRGELGDEMFWRAIRRYCEVNQFRTVETADLRIAIADATGQELNWFFDQWTNKGGHPEFNVAWKWNEAQKSVELTVKQTQKVDEITPLFRASVDVELAMSGPSILRKITVSKPEETYHFALDSKPTRVCFDPRDWVLKRLVFEKSKEEWLDQLARSEHVICRTQAVEALAKLDKDDDSRDALLRAAKGDAFWGVRQEAVRALGKQSGDTIRAALLAIAKDDTKSHVRREAISALGSFAHDETRQALRQIIVNEKSYHAVADALRALVKVDRDNCLPLLLAALDQESHHEVIRQAACDGLADLKSDKGAEKLTQLLAGKLLPEQRVVLLGALARLKADDAQVFDQLKGELDQRRANVRRTAVDLLVALGDPRAIEPLLARRGKEESNGVVRAIDSAVEKLRGQEKNVSDLRKELEGLRKQNRDLEERLKKLENGK